MNITIEITPDDIQPKKTRGESCDQRVRNAWALQMTDEHKSKFMHFPGMVRQQLYRAWDFEVQNIWVGMMRDARIEALKNGAKMVKVAGIHKLQDEFCADVDELLIQAAQLWLANFVHRQSNTNV